MSEPQGDPSSSVTNAQLLRPGEVVDGRYRVEAYLGGGGMASVYRATHVVLEQPVALKIVSPQIRSNPDTSFERTSNQRSRSVPSRVSKSSP